MSSVTAAGQRDRLVEGAVGWRRWMRTDADGERALLVSRPSESSTASHTRLRRVALLRHPGLSRVQSVEFDSEGPCVVEWTGDSRSLSDGRCRMPRGDDLARGLIRILEALAYLQRQELGHGAVSRQTVFSDGRTLLLTGAALSERSIADPAEDVRAWAEISVEVISTARGADLTEVVHEAAAQVLAATREGHSIDAARVLRAINRALPTDDPGEPAGSESPEEATEEEYASSHSRSMRALHFTGNLIGSMIVGLFTTLLTLAVIGAVVAGGVLWFLDQLPAEVPVPNVVGMERAEADRRLEAAGLEAGRVRSVYREDVDPGHVAETTPPPGMMVREGREITLVVSMGAARVSVPRLTGLTVDEASDLLESKGLRLVEGGKMRSNMSEGEIVRQDPSPTRVIAQGESVVVRTSGGPEFGVIEMPAEDEGEDPRQIVFRRIEIIVPRGDALQRVVVLEGYGDNLETTYDRLHRPGDRITLDTYGRPGKNVEVLIEREQVFKTQF